MSISVDDCNRVLFSGIVGALSRVFPDTPIVPTGRWITSDNLKEDQRKFVAAKQVAFSVSPKSDALFVESDGEHYVICSGTENEDAYGILEQVELTAWHFLLFGYQSKKFVINNPDHAREIIVGRYLGAKGHRYNGHNWREIADLFQPLSAFRIDKSALAASDPHRLHCVLILSNSNSMFLEFPESVLEAFFDLLTSGPASVPYENILRGICSVYWYYSFLDVYRCVEALYPISSIHPLRKRIGYSGSTIELTDKIIDEMNWFPNESNSVDKLFSGLPEPIINEFRAALALTADEMPAKKFYRTRNEVVHFKFGAKKMDISNVDWPLLIKATIAAVHEMYAHFEKEDGCFQIVVASA